MSEKKMIHKWSSLKYKIQQKWEELTEEDLEQIEGNRNQLIEKLQNRYGFSKEKAEKELSTWEDRLSREDEQDDEESES